MRIVLVRHTPVKLLDGICYGRSDVELASGWSAHVETMRAKLARDVLAAAWVYSSPLRRCLDLARHLRKEVVTDERLLEMDFGRWELKRWRDIPPPEMEAWTRDVVRTAPPGGESLLALSERTGRFLDDLHESGHETAILVTHGGVIRCILARLLGLPLANALRLRVDYGSVSQVRTSASMIQIEYVNR